VFVDGARGFFFFLLYLSHFFFPCTVGSDFKIAICGGNFFIRVSGIWRGDLITALEWLVGRVFSA